MRSKNIGIILIIASFCCVSLDGAESAGDDTGVKPEKSVIISESEDSLKCLDADGHEVNLRKNPKRTITCYTSFASLWQLAGGNLTAMPNTSSREVLASSLKDVELIGGFSNPNMEKIISLKPDLVLLSSRVEKHRAAKEILEKSGIDSILLSYENYGDFLKLLELFSRLNGKKIAENQDARKIVDAVDSTIRKVPAGKGPRFLSLFASGMKATTAETGRANTAHIAELLGGRNVMSGVGAPGSSLSANLSMEKIMAEDPDVIFFTTMGDEKEVREKMENELKSEATWASLRAVREKRFHFLPNELFLYKANEKYPDSFRMLYGIMYPGEPGK